MLLTHVKYFSAQIVLENIEEYFNIEPDAKVDEGHVDWTRCKGPDTLVHIIIWPEDKKAENDRDRDYKAGKSNAACVYPSVVPRFLGIDFLFQVIFQMFLAQLINLGLLSRWAALLKICILVRRDLFLGIIDD